MGRGPRYRVRPWSLAAAAVMLGRLAFLVGFGLLVAYILLAWAGRGVM